MNMERRELYEPEDIEQLLIERSYDELLEEERAFVLRHLSGRDEYEAMRALLLKVHDDEELAAPIDADPSVRAHVMDVFRAEQRPQWRIWLNSVHAFLLPKEASALWRPVLALGTVALVILFIANPNLRLEGDQQLAEVKEVPKAAPGTGEKETPSASDQAQQDPVGTRTDQARVEARDEPTEEVTTKFVPSDEMLTLDEHQAATAAENIAEAPPPDASVQETADLAKTEVATVGSLDAQANGTETLPGTSTITLDSTSPAGASFSHVVTGNELSLNFSAAAATPSRPLESVSVTSAKRYAEREKAKKAERRDRTVSGWSNGEGEATADVGGYLDLLRAAW